jgi:hypothetical protein
MSDGLNILKIDDAASRPEASRPKKPEVITPGAHIAATAVASLVAAVCFYMAVQYGGWGTLALFFPYVWIWVIHIYTHWRASRHFTLKILTLAVASNVFLLSAFLLQWDAGDAPGGWLTITALLEDYSRGGVPTAPAWWPQTLAMNLVAFIPEMLLVAALFWQSREVHPLSETNT